MRKPIHITAPWSTPEELDKRFPIPKARKKELQALVDQFIAMHLNRDDASANSITPEKRRKRASAA